MDSTDDYFKRVKAEILAEAEIARVRAPLPRREPPPRGSTAPVIDVSGIERDRLDYRIAELTDENYIAFVEQAYRAILKRPGDEAGRNSQINHLAKGASKAEILGNLRWSPEGRRVGAHIRGLLPRYLLAKLSHVRGIGYLVDWCASFASLPLLLRHQRAADVMVASKIGELAQTLRACEKRLGELEQKIERGTSQVEQRLRVIDERFGIVDTRLVGHTQTVDELRHYVYAGNHWLATVQRNFADLERIADEQRQRVDVLAAGVQETEAQIEAHSTRHARWSSEIAARLHAGARVLDLGSGDGAWLAGLAACGMNATGVEPVSPLVKAATLQARTVATGDPLAALERCSDGSLDAITLADASLCCGSASLLRLLDATARVLARPGWLFVRVEAEPRRADAGSGLDAERWRALLAAAGFEELAVVEVAGGSLVAARCAGAVAQSVTGAQ